MNRRNGPAGAGTEWRLERIEVIPCGLLRGIWFESRTWFCMSAALLLRNLTWKGLGNR